MHIVGDDCVLADANLPRKFPEDKIRVGIARLEVLVGLAQVISSAHLVCRELLANSDVVPMSVIFAEVANALVRIEQQVFIPGVTDALDFAMAPLKADDLVVRAAQLAARTQGNEGPYVTRLYFELLEDGEVGVFGVEDGMAAPAHDRFGLAERTQRDGRAALRAIQRLRLRLRRPGKWRSASAHHQPSKLRRFFNLRSSNSTNSPRYRAGSGSL